MCGSIILTCFFLTTLFRSRMSVMVADEETSVSTGKPLCRPGKLGIKITFRGNSRDPGISGIDFHL
jgi:hypothetical protein